MSKKSKQTKGGRTTLLSALVLILIVTNAVTVYYFMFMQDTVPAEDAIMNIGDISGENLDNYIGKTITLQGFLLFASNNYLLVTNPLLYFNNSLNPSNYVVLSGAVPIASMNESIGREIAVKGVVRASQISGGGADFQVDSFFDVFTDVTYPGIYNDKKIDPYLEFSDIPYLFDPTPEKYAVLFSGGIDPQHAYSRYWNDIIYMYFILQMHGYDAENIYVIYKDGVGEDPYTPVDYPATHASLNTVFAALSQEMGRADTLFFYTTNHGGGNGISVWGPMDNSGALTHNQVANWLDSITCHHMIIVMEQCVSGKYIQYLSAQNRVILTACKDDESSYSADTEGNWDEFVYHFMCALVGIPWNGDGSTVDADFDNDGYVSMREAFVWAAAKDSRPETPWYNDNGDGVGYTALEVIFGSGPWAGDHIGLGQLIP